MADTCRFGHPERLSRIGRQFDFIQDNFLHHCHTDARPRHSSLFIRYESFTISFRTSKKLFTSCIRSYKSNVAHSYIIELSGQFSDYPDPLDGIRYIRSLYQSIRMFRISVMAAISVSFIGETRLNRIFSVLRI